MSALVSTRLSDLEADPGRLAYAGLRLSGWVVVTALSALGALLFALLVIVGFDLPLFFGQLGNLGGRFIAADPARQADMAHQLAIGWAAGFAGIGFFRRGSFRVALREKGIHHD